MVRFEPLTTGVVTSESVSRSSTITDNPVEGGSNIQDHVFTQPLSFRISGRPSMARTPSPPCKRCGRAATIITYTGRNRISNLVIQQLQSTHDAKNRGGFTFTATLKQVTLGSSVDSGTASTMAGMDAAASASQPKATTKAAQKSSSQTSSTKADGLKTTVSTTISSSAYMSYVNSFNSKPKSSAGPTSRATPQQHREEVTDHAAY